MPLTLPVFGPVVADLDDFELIVIRPINFKTILTLSKTWPSPPVRGVLLSEHKLDHMSCKLSFPPNSNRLLSKSLPRDDTRLAKRWLFKHCVGSVRNAKRQLRGSIRGWMMWPLEGCSRSRKRWRTSGESSD